MREFRNSESKTLFEYWMSLNDGRMPHYRQWDPIRVPKQMPWCSIIERGGETGFRLRFAGTALCEFYGDEMTGEPVGQRMDPKARHFYMTLVQEILRRPCGIFFTTHVRADSGRDCLMDVLGLPLADEDGVGCRILTHQIIIEEVTYGEAKTRFASPQVAEWIDIGASTPPALMAPNEL